MGQSRNRLQRMISDHPFCAFCGGDAPTTSVEHMPSRILFDSKQRPKGMEFPSCGDCQESTRKAELVVALLSRLYPEPETQRQREEIREIMRSAEHNNRGLLAEMKTDQLETLQQLGSRAFALPTWHFLDVSGPIAKTAIHLFARKLALAFHYDLTGEIVPKGARLFVDQYSNFHALTEGMPTEMMDYLGNEKTLRMGRQHVFEQFSWQSAQVVDGSMTAHMAYFRKSMALLLVVYPDVGDLSEEGLEYTIVV